MTALRPSHRDFDAHIHNALVLLGTTPELADAEKVCRVLMAAEEDTFFGTEIVAAAIERLRIHTENVDAPTKSTPLTSQFNPDSARPYTWSFIVTIDVCETVVADGFDPFDPERDLSPRDVLDNIVGNVDSWGEQFVEIVDVQPLVVPDRLHIRRAQGYRENETVSERDRKVIAEAIERLLTHTSELKAKDALDEMQNFVDALRMDADGDHVQLAADVIHTIEHGSED